MKYLRWLACLFVLYGPLAGAAYAQAVTPMPSETEAPVFQVGDEWRMTDGVRRQVVGFEDGFTVVEINMPQCGGCREFRDKNAIVVKVLTAKGEPFPTDSVGLKFVDFPLKIGKEWSQQWQGAAGGGGVSLFRNTFKVEAYEQVKTKAGTFKAFRISFRQDNLHYRWSGDSEIWYAPEVRNVVKRTVYTSQWGSGWELESFTRGHAVAEKPSPPKVEAPKALEQPVAAEKSPQKPTDQPMVAEAPVPSKSAAPAVVEKVAAQKEKTDKAQGITDMKKGEGGSVVQGAAGPSGSQGAASDLERCDKPMATLAVVEPQIAVTFALGRYGLKSPVGLIRLMVQQSNCFLVVERGAGMQNVMQERALADSGQLRQGSNMGGSQMMTADYVMTPSVAFSENDAGGIGGVLGGFIPGVGGALFSAIAGGLKFKEAQTSMLLADTRTSLQVASAEGSAKKADLSLGGLVVGGGAGAALGGYANTNEGKVIAASFMDNYNHIVRAVRNAPSLQREVRSLAEEAAARPKAGAAFSEGDVLRPKISNVKLLDKPSESADTASVLAKSEELIFLGKEQDGFVNVETAKGSGWVKKILVTR